MASFWKDERKGERHIFYGKKITFNFSKILATGIYNDTDNAVK
jgi:hypothetical protein